MEFPHPKEGSIILKNCIKTQNKKHFTKIKCGKTRLSIGKSNKTMSINFQGKNLGSSLLIKNNLGYSKAIKLKGRVAHDMH
jgi:hypothetical protein